MKPGFLSSAYIAWFLLFMRSSMFGITLYYCNMPRAFPFLSRHFSFHQCVHWKRFAFSCFWKEKKRIVYTIRMFISNALEESIIIMGLNIHLHTFPTLETERLILRQLAATDAQDCFLFLSDEETMRYYDPAPMTQLEQAEKSIERHRRRFAQHEALRWGIILKGE